MSDRTTRALLVLTVTNLLVLLAVVVLIPTPLSSVRPGTQTRIITGQCEHVYLTTRTPSDTVRLLGLRRVWGYGVPVEFVIDSLGVVTDVGRDLEGCDG